MDKFFSHLVAGGGGGKKNHGKSEDKKQQSKDALKNSWQGGSGDLESMKKVPSKLDSSKNILTNAGAGISDALGKIDLFNKSNKAANTRGGGQSLGGINRGEGTGGKSSLDAIARKQAVIAAAEAREAKHKATQKPIQTTEKRMYDKEIKNQQKGYEHDPVIDSEETRRAVAAVKLAEKEDVAKLGYNPYEAKAMTSGQARTATVAMVKGEIKAENAPSKIIGNGETPSPGRSKKPRDPTKTADPSPEFEHAFSILVTSNSDHLAVLKSLSTMRTLIRNATTKGQQGNDETSSKYRRIRLSNPKIIEAITNMQGALELMMSVGFVLSENEEDGETYLVYPPGENEAAWIESALERIDSYENGGL
jgi:hypothetical protein